MLRQKTWNDNRRTIERTFEARTSYDFCLYLYYSVYVCILHTQSNVKKDDIDKLMKTIRLYYTMG